MTRDILNSDCRQTYIAIGGTQQNHGGVEMFMRRLAKLWSDSGLGSLAVSSSDSAIFKAPHGVIDGVRRWWRSHRRNVRHIRQAVQAAEGQVTHVWYHYGNALDLVAIALLSWMRGIRLVVTPHCSLTWRHLAHPVGRWITHRILRRTDLLVVLSQEQVDFFSVEGGPRVVRMRTLLPAFTAHRSSFGERPPGSLVFVGRVSAEKGIPDMIELLKMLRAQRDGFSLEIFGEAEPEMTVFLNDVMQREPALAAAIRVRGRIPPQDVLTQLGRNRYLVYLSRVDAFPLAVLEAVIAGAVPVVYELPGTAEIVERWGGIMAAPADLQTLACAILRTDSETSSPPLRSEQAAQYYSTTEVARELRIILES